MTADRSWLTRLALGIVVAAAIGLFAAFIGRTVALAAMLENWLVDLRIGLTAEAVPPDPEIAIVAITEETLATLPYRHPVDRGLLAQIVRKADAAGAEAIAFDILFDQPTDPAKDADLAAAVRNAKLRIVIGYADVEDGLTNRQKAHLDAYLPGAERAYVNLVRDDRDGIVRATLTGRPVGTEVRPGLAIALADRGGSIERRVIRLRRALNGGGSPFPLYPAHALHFLPDAWLKDRILLVGAVLPQEDRFPTSLVALNGIEAGTRPGVEIHAHALADQLAGQPLVRAGWGIDVLLATCLAFVGLAAGGLSGRLIWKVAGAAGILATFWWAGASAMNWTGVLIPLFMPTIALFSASGIGAAIASRRHRAEKQFIRDAMSRYVAESVVEDLQRNPEKLKLGGERRELTLIFTDIAGFTTTSEATPPDVLVPILNAYLDGMSRIIMGHGGTVDKYIGDAVVAIFGAPIEQSDHAARALACARELDAFARAFVSDGAAREIGLGTTRIGVHTGPAVVGNIGGDARFDYTAIGDTVNTAARLEGANKYLGTTICISAPTVEAAGAKRLRPIGDLVLKGRRAPLRVYDPGSLGEIYADAFAALEVEDPERARDLLTKVPVDSADAPLARFHLARLDEGMTSTVIELEGK